MKKILILLVGIFIITNLKAQINQTNSISRNNQGVLVHEKTIVEVKNLGQIYYDIVSYRTSIVTSKEVNHIRYRGKEKIKYVSNPTVFYFYEVYDTFKIHINANFNEKLIILKTNKHDVFNLFNMGFVVKSIGIVKKENWVDVTYYCENDKMLGSDLGYYTLTISKNGEMFWFILSAYKTEWLVNGDINTTVPVLIYQIDKKTMILDEKFWKMNDKYMFH